MDLRNNEWSWDYEVLLALILTNNFEDENVVIMFLRVFLSAETEHESIK